MPLLLAPLPDRGEPDALLFIFGAMDRTAYTKSMALQVHLFGFELENVIVTLLPNAIHVLASDEICRAMENGVDESAEVRGPARTSGFQPLPSMHQNSEEPLHSLVPTGGPDRGPSRQLRG